MELDFTGIASIVLALATLLGAVFSGIVSLRNSQRIVAAAAKSDQQHEATRQKQVEISESITEHTKHINSRMDQLLKLIAAEAFAKGKEEGEQNRGNVG